MKTRPGISDPGRFALATMGDEALVLDVASGEICRADASGIVVFRALGRGEGIDGAAAALARTFDTTRRRAKRDVQAMLLALPDAPHGRATRSSISLTASSRGGYDVTIQGARAAWIDAAATRVERTATRPRISSGLRVAAPHVLALRGRAVLHACAVVSRGGVVAFVGPSGVGKSTIARRLARCSMRVIAEDLLVLANAREAALHGEQRIRAWARTRAASARSDELLACASGARRPLRAVLLVERARGQDGITVETLRGVDAIAALFANAFVEVPDPRVWRSALATCRALAARRVVHRVRVPEGLGALHRALAVSSDFENPVEALLGRGRRPNPRVAHAMPTHAENEPLLRGT